MIQDARDVAVPAAKHASAQGSGAVRLAGLKL